MGIQELMDIWELGARNSPCCAPALAHLKHPPPGSMLFAAAWVQPPEEPLCAHASLHPQHHPCPTDTQPHSTPCLTGPLAQHNCNWSGRELGVGGRTDGTHTHHGPCPERPHPTSHHKQMRSAAFSDMSLSLRHPGVREVRGAKKSVSASTDLHWVRTTKG